MALTAAVFEIHIKAVSDTEFRNSRRGEEDDLRILVLRERDIRLQRDSLRIGTRSRTVSPVLQLDEAKAHVLAAAGKREACHVEDRYRHILTLLEEVIADRLLSLSHMRLRAARGRLHREHQRSLVLIRNEGSRQLHEAEDHAGPDDGVADKRQSDVVMRPEHQITNPSRHALEPAVKGAEEAALMQVIVIDRFQNRSAERWRQTQCHHH